MRLRKWEFWSFHPAPNKPVGELLGELAEFGWEPVNIIWRDKSTPCPSIFFLVLKRKLTLRQRLYNYIAPWLVS